MSQPINDTGMVHTLFQAFHERGLPNKRELCDELRSLIRGQHVQGRGPISQLLEDGSAPRAACSPAMRTVLDEMFPRTIPAEIFPTVEVVPEEEGPPARRGRRPLGVQAPATKTQGDIRRNVVAYVIQGLQELMPDLENVPQSESYAKLDMIADNMEMYARILHTLCTR